MCNQGSRPPIAGGIGEVPRIPADVTRMVVVDDLGSSTERTAVWLVDRDGAVALVGASRVNLATLAERVESGALVTNDGIVYVARPEPDPVPELTATPPSRLRVAARRLCLLLHAATGVRA